MVISLKWLLLTGLALLCNAGIATSDGVGAKWGVNPSDCRAVDTYVTCPWTSPPSLPPNGTCELYFRLPEGHSHTTIPFCSSIDNWTSCPEEYGFECHFPSYEKVLKQSVFNSCGPDIEARINCSDDSISPVVKINQHEITIPGPVTNLTAEATGSSEIKVTWKRPKDWTDDYLLSYVIQYEQEYSPALYEYYQIVGFQNKYFHLIKENLTYADALTTVRVAVYYTSNPLKNLSEWSEVQVKTEMAAPRQEPRNIMVSDIEVDWEQNIRTINLTWEPIPDKFSGGPILRYLVTLKTHDEEGGTTNQTISTIASHRQLGLNPTYHYKIDIIAENQVGRSDPGEYTLRGLNTKPENNLYYAGIAVSCLVLLLILISGLWILRKKMKGSPLPPITLPQKPVAVKALSSKKEQEVFDSLKSSAPPLIQNDYSSNVEKALREPVLTKSGAQLQKLDLVNEEMPLAKDLDLTGDNGSISPTDSGLNCDYTPDMPDELSPIPVAFHPRTGSLRSHEFGVFNQGETEALIGTDGQSTSEKSTDLESSSTSSSDSCQNDRNNSVQALAYSDSDIRHGNNSLGYSQISERPVDGYIAQPMVPTGPSANSHIAPTEASDGPVTSDGSISSYVQHVGMTTGPPDEGAVNQTSTSGRSDCPSYVKQSAPSSDVV